MDAQAASVERSREVTAHERELILFIDELHTVVGAGAAEGSMEVSDEAVEYLANAGYDPQYGARPLRRAIQRLLEDPLSERLLAGEIEPGQHVRVDLADGALQFEVTGEAGQERESESEAVTTA